MPTHLVLDGVDLSLQPLDGPVHLRNLIPGIPEVISMLPSPGLEGLKLERPYREVWQGVENDYGRFISLPTQGRPMVVGDKPSWLIFPRRDGMTPSNPHPMPGDQTLGSGLGLSVLPAQEPCPHSPSPLSPSLAGICGFALLSLPARSGRTRMSPRAYPH